MADFQSVQFTSIWNRRHKSQWF